MNDCISLNELKNLDSPFIDKLQDFFRKNKGRAYRQRYLEDVFPEINKSTIRVTLGRLYSLNILDKKIISQCCVYYFWKE